MQSCLARTSPSTILRHRPPVTYRPPATIFRYSPRGPLAATTSRRVLQPARRPMVGPPNSRPSTSQPCQPCLTVSQSCHRQCLSPQRTPSESLRRTSKDTPRHGTGQTSREGGQNRTRSEKISFVSYLVSKNGTTRGWLRHTTSSTDGRRTRRTEERLLTRLGISSA